MQSKFFALIRTVALFTVLAGLTTCAVNPVTGKKQLMFVSEEQEKAMGLQANPQILSEFGEYPDAQLQAFINEKGKQMAAVSHRSNLDFKFTILDSDVVNAFAVPGGYVYFTRGIMAHFNNEAEFAGVLGHEIGHVTARHSAQQQTQQILSQGGLLVGIIAVPELAQVAEVASQGLQLLQLKFSRDHESQSDELGVAYSTAVGYDAKEMAGFFRTIDRLSGGNNGGIPNFLSTHPNPLDRYKRVGEMAAAAQRSSGRSDFKVNRENYLRLIDGIIYGPDPKQGYVDNSVFYHPELKFQFPVPPAWQLQNSPSQVQMAPKDGKALMIFTMSPEKTLQAAANLAVTKDSLRVLESQNTRLNGLNALVLTADRRNAQNPAQPIRLSVTLIEYNGLIYKFYGMSLANDFATYSSLFQSTMRNFKVLTDPSKINILPERVRIETVKANGSLAEVLRDYNIADKRMEEHAVLNGLVLTDQLRAGDLVKVIRREAFNR